MLDDVLVGEKSVEHVFFGGDYLIENASGEVETIADCKEREQDHQQKDLAGRELTVRGLGKVHLWVSVI